MQLLFSNFEISAPRYNRNGAVPIYRLLDGYATASSNSDFLGKRITYPIDRGLLQVWFKLPNSYVLNNFKLFNDNNIASFNLKTASSITDVVFNRTQFIIITFVFIHIVKEEKHLYFVRT